MNKGQSMPSYVRVCSRVIACLALMTCLSASQARGQTPVDEVFRFDFSNQDWVARAQAEEQVPPHHEETVSIASRDGVLPALFAGENIFAQARERKPNRFPGAAHGENPLWGTPNINVGDPTKYPHITSLDVDDPNSFFYWMRPNLFGEPVEDEWDWLNMINTERPDFTDITYAVGKGVTYLENGFTYNRIIDGANRDQILTVPESLLRYGLTDEIEIRYKWNGLMAIDQNNTATNERFINYGQQDSDISMKFELLQQKNWLPMTVLNTGLLLPTGTRGFAGQGVQPHFNIINGWGVRRYLYLKHQIGMDYLTQPVFSANGFAMPNTELGINQIMTTHPVLHSYHSSISALYHMSKHWGGFHEWYVIYGPRITTANYWNSGLFYYLTPNIQVDAVLGRELNVGTDFTFCKGGISFRW